MQKRPEILLVEDSRTQAERLRGLFEGEGWQVTAMPSAEAALDELTRMRPDLIVVDFYLPGMKGDEFCRELRMNAVTRDVPVLILTVEGAGEAEQRGLESGADDYVAKSVDPQVLLLRMRALLRMPSAPAPVRSGAYFRRARLLAIDDSPTFLEWLSRELAGEGYEIEKAASGEQGLERAARQNFDCVLIDLKMPGMNGIEVCRRMAGTRRGIGPTSALLVHTAYDDREHMTQALEAGADDFVGKNADVSLLKARIRALLRRKFLVDENRRIFEEISRKELEAVRARAEQKAAEERAVMAEKLAQTNRELEEANRKLKASYDLTVAITEHAADALFLLDSAGRVTFTNPAAERMFGFTRDELIGQALHERVHHHRPDGSAFPAEDCPFLRSLETGVAVAGLEEVFLRKDLSPVDVVCSSAPVLEDGRVTAAVLVVHDDSERRRAEERLRQTQKLESVGLLAGGIAHDFNNLLTGILGNASLAIEEADPEQQQRLAAVIDGAEKAANLTRQLLAYAGKGRFQVRDVDLSQTVREITALLRLSVPKNIALGVRLGERLPFVQADEGQMQQIVMNLVINASEAIGEAIGSIDVATGVETAERPFTDALGQQIAPGEYVALLVKDTGCGMDEKTKARMFDPFFTTKFVGRGLGMAAVSGIVRSQCGGIVIDSAPGKGTAIKVLLPAAAARLPKSSVPELDAAPPCSQTGTVLVVDDEEAVRDFIGKVLVRAGYRVLSAANGQEAIGIFEREGAAVDLVVLDLIMPVRGGSEVLHRIRELKPAVKVLLTSGYSREEAARHCAALEADDFIQKPYSANDLALKVSSVMK